MKKRQLALVMSVAMVLTCMPVNILVGFAEDVTVEGSVALNEAVGVNKVTEDEALDVAKANFFQVSEDVVSEKTGIESEEESDQEYELLETVSVEECNESEAFGVDMVPMDDDDLGNIETDDFLEGIEVIESEEATDSLEMAAGGSNFYDAEVMTLDKWYDVNLTIDYEDPTDVYFCYIPDSDGIYTFVAEGDCNMSSSLEDSSDWLTGTSKSGNNFNLTYKLTAGEVYYLIIYDILSDNYSEANFSVMVSNKNYLLVSAEEETIIKPCGEKATMDVLIESSDISNCQWFLMNDDYEYEIVENATEPTLTITVPTQCAYYKCVITSGTTSKDVCFYVYSEQYATVFEEPRYYSVAVLPGTKKTLTVDDACLDYGPFTYDWREILGEFGRPLLSSEATLSITADDVHRVYECVVSDGGLSSICIFDVIPGTMNDSYLQLGTTQVTISEIYNIYGFIPQKTGSYNICASSEYAQDAVLYDSNGETLSGCGLNYCVLPYLSNEENIGGYLIAGETYYIAVGFRNRVAGNCNISIQFEYEHQHSYRAVSHINPTCISNGSVDYECNLCGSRYTDSVPALEHNYGAYVVATPATVLATGVKTRTCVRCGEKQTTSIAKITPTINVNATNIPLKVKQSTTKIKVTMGTGDYISSWKSNKPKIAKVSSSGKITGVKAGTAKITVTLASGLSKTITVKVQKAKVKTKKISGVSSRLTLQKGAKITLAPVITPITTTDKVKYSTTNKKIATVSSKGVITAKKKGKVKITVKCGTKKKTITVTVK